MKTTAVFLFVCLTMGVSQAQSGLNTALGKGDISGISSHFGEKIELTIGAKEEILTKSAAEVRLREFYAAHVPKGYTTMHAGNAKSNESNYAIGELATEKGNFRVYIYYTKLDQKQVVAELRIE